MNEGEVRAQFRILGDNVKGDVAKIQGDIASQMKQSGAGTPLSKVASDMDKNMAASLERAVGRKGAFSSTSEAFKKLNPDLFKGGGGGGGGGGLPSAAGGFGGRRKEPPILADLKAKMDLDRAKFIKDATFAMMPLFNPTSVWGNLFASRQIFSAFSGTKAGGRLMGAAGLSGTGGAALATGGVVAALMAVGATIKVLSKTIQEATKAYIEAPKMYAKALTGGLGLRLTTQRSLLAQVMGVSEQDVFKFGQAFAYLNPKIAWASNILASTNRNLTSVGWSFSVLQIDMQAMFATIANDAAPAMRKFVSVLDEIIKSSTEFYNQHKEQVAQAAGVFAKMVAGFGGMALITGVKKMIASGKDPGAAPPPMPWMKQLRASPWEHLGLNIGGQGQSDYARRAAVGIEAIKAMCERNLKSMERGQYVPFILSPVVGNP
jgi:hypothetical protein